MAKHAEFEKMYRDPRGWITPKGEYIHADPYGHLEELSDDNLDDPELTRMLFEWANEKEARESEHLELAEREGNSNAEWHVYEIWHDKALPAFREKFTAALYGKGWVRVGYSCRNRYGTSVDLIEFEGTSEGLERASRAIDDLLAAGNYGCAVERRAVPPSRP